jgi:aspartate ammonia-lyase
VSSLAMVKQAAAMANRDFGLLDPDIAGTIIEACRRVEAGEANDAFIVDMLQGGAGTSTNMNVNEVIANVALKLLGRPRGDYRTINPNDHVNLSQSTNDVYPTAVRLTVLRCVPALVAAQEALVAAFLAKAEEFHDVIKVGRTQLMDAVPMRLGSEFRAFAVTVGEDIDRLGEFANLLREINLGGTAIGTGINTPEGYAHLVIARRSLAYP